MIFEFCRLTDAEIVENAVTVLLLTNATLIVGIVASYFSGWKMGKSINEMEEDDFYDTHQ